MTVLGSSINDSSVTVQLLLVLGLYCHQVFHRVIRIITLYFLDCWKNW